MATSVNRNIPRQVTTISLRILEIAWKPISGRNRPKAISAVSPASRNAAATGFGAFMTSGMSDLLDVRTAEQALRQEDQRDRKHREGGDVLVVEREVGRPHRLDQADEDAADHRAGQRADAAEHGGGEGLDA